MQGIAHEATAGRLGEMSPMKFLPFILFTVLTNAAAQLMLKQGMLSMNGLIGLPDNIVLKLLHVVFNPWVFAGLVTFVISMASHLFVLSKVELSFAYPFLSLAYVAVAVFAWLLFKEDLNAWRIAGIAFICVGTVLIARSGAPDETELAHLSEAARTTSHAPHEVLR